MVKGYIIIELISSYVEHIHFPRLSLGVARGKK